MSTQAGDDACACISLGHELSCRVQRLVLASRVLSQALYRSDTFAQSVLDQLRRGHPPDATEDWPQTLRHVDLETCQHVAERLLSDAKPSIAVSIPAFLIRGSNPDADVRELHFTDC